MHASVSVDVLLNNKVDKAALLKIKSKEECIDTDSVTNRKLSTIEESAAEDYNGNPSQGKRKLNLTKKVDDRQNKKQKKIPIIVKSANATLLQSIKEHPVQCQVCNMELINNYPLHDHMQIKSERQCNDCKLFFASCYVLGKHQNGRCRKRSIK